MICAGTPRPNGDQRSSYYEIGDDRSVSLADLPGVWGRQRPKLQSLPATCAAATGLFSYATFCLNKSRYTYSINSSTPKYSFYKLSSDLRKLSLAVYFADIIKFTSAAEQSDGDILRFFAMTLYKLEKENSDLSLIKAIFELRTASMLGFMPDLRACSECACYEHEKMIFLWEESKIICGDCFDSFFSESLHYMLSSSLLYAMRYVVYSPLEKVYGFSLKGETAERFYYFAEFYLQRQLGRDFKSLDYYKNLKDY